MIALGQHQPVYAFLLFKLQFGLSFVWLTAMQTAIPGLLPVLAALLYRFVSSVYKPGHSGTAAWGMMK